MRKYGNFYIPDWNLDNLCYVKAQRDKLNQVRHEFDRAADRYNQDIDRMTEKLQNIHFQYEKAKTEKEKTELQSLKLSRDLERTTEELIELREARGIAEKTDMETRNETERITKTLEEVNILIAYPNFYTQKMVFNSKGTFFAAYAPISSFRFLFNYHTFFWCELVKEFL